MSDYFTCRDCWEQVIWMTGKSGKRYLAQPKEWFGDQYGAQRTYFPSHRCTPDPTRQAAYAAEQAEKAERIAAFEASKAAEEELRAAGVTVPTGRVTVTGVVVSVKVQDSPYGFTVKMLVKSAEGWKVWGTMPRSLEGNYNTIGAEEGDTVTFAAALTPSDDDPLFGFFKRPTKASIVARGSEKVTA